MANHDTYEKDILKALQKIGIQMEAVNKNLIKLAEAIQSINTGSLVDPCIRVDVTTSADLSTDPLHLRITPGPEEVS